jgi:hypothetical protein
MTTSKNTCANRNDSKPRKETNLLQVANDLLEVVFGRDALNSGDRFPTSSLLNTDMAEALARALLIFELLERI